MARLCHRSNVALKGMTPLIFASDSGSEPGLAMMSAADEDRPRAQMLPSPR